MLCNLGNGSSGKMKLVGKTLQSILKRYVEQDVHDVFRSSQ